MPTNSMPPSAYVLREIVKEVYGNAGHLYIVAIPMELTTRR